MGSVGDAYDSAMCESFFATLETELIERKSFLHYSHSRCFDRVSIERSFPSILLQYLSGPQFPPSWGCVSIHSRDSSRASAISSRVIACSIFSMLLCAVSFPWAAERLNHI